MNFLEAKKIMTKLCISNKIPKEGIEAYTTIIDHYENIIKNRSKKPVPWTEEDEQRLINLYNENCDITTISNEIGRSIRAIDRRIAFLKNKKLI